MSAPRWQKIAALNVAEIEAVARYRDASDEAARSIASSIREIGIMLNPITVRRVKGGYRLIDGMHRLRAAEMAGLDEVPVRVCECTDAQAMRMEVDANLATAPLSPLDLAVFLAAHKKLYEAEHPETKRAFKAQMARRNQPNSDCTDIMSVQSFAVNAAVSFGKTERHIRRLIEIGDKLPREGVDLLRSAPKRPEFGDLTVIAKAAPDERMAICAAYAKGKTTAAKALKSLRALPGAAVDDPVEKARGRLVDVWARASKEARKRFVADHYDEIQPLVSDVWRARQTATPADAARDELARRRADG